jgi:RNA polymerase sigma factor (TIGR02999 family)
MPGEVTALLARLREGDADALSRLIPIVYAELRRLAMHYMRGERIEHTLQATALVNEAFLRLVDQDRMAWQNRSQFVGVAAQAMRRILVDHARRRIAAKRARLAVQIADDSRVGARGNAGAAEEVLAVNEALKRLAGLDVQQARIVEMRYFGGLSVEETAEALRISPRTVKRDWSMARAWLRMQLGTEK